MISVQKTALLLGYVAVKIRLEGRAPIKFRVEKRVRSGTDTLHNKNSVYIIALLFGYVAIKNRAEGREFYDKKKITKAMHSDYNKSVHDEYITFAIIFERNMNLHYKWEN